MPRAGSPTYWVPRLAVHPSVHEMTKSTSALCHNDPQAEQCSQSTAKPIPLSRFSGSHLTTEGMLPPHSCIQTGKKPWGFHNSVATRKSPTQAPSLYNRTPPSVRYIVTVAIPIFRRATRTSST